LEKGRDVQTSTDSKTALVEQINKCLHSGEYSRALELLRGTAGEFPNDTELAELEKHANNGIKRNAEANRLITESQELFAQQKTAEAIQLLREAYELDKKNSLARAILANALTEQAHAVVEADWPEAEMLANQALALNPAHPTAKTIRSLVVEQKKRSSVEDWVSRARRLQSSGDLFAALAWVAEGLAVHPEDPRLLQVHDSIQSEQGARRRQARRRDLQDLRRMELEIDGAADVAAKQALVERIQVAAAKYWTDGEILSIANRLLHRLGVAYESSITSPHGPGAPVIFHVPLPSAPKPSQADTNPVPPSQVVPSQLPPKSISSPGNVPTGSVPPTKVAVSIVQPLKVPTTPQEPQLPPPQAAAVPALEISASTTKVTPQSSQPKQLAALSSTTLILVSATAIILVAATLFFMRRHYVTTAAKTTSAARTIPAPAIAAQPVSSPAESAPIVSAGSASAPAQSSSERSLPAVPLTSDTGAGKIAVDHEPPTESRHNLGTLLVVAGQDNARVFLNGKLQQQLTQGGQLRLPNLESKDYVVQVSKSGFQDPPRQKIRIRKGEQARLMFDLQPQPRLASLTVQGTPGTTVLVDQAVVGTIQSDGTLSASTVNPGDHTIELRKERFKPRQFKKHFVAGGAISLTAADAVLEAAPGELKITFTPADATVALVKGEILTKVSSGVPLNLGAGTYTLSARTADKFTRGSTLEVIAGQSKTLNLSLAPSGMSKWKDPSAWKYERDSFIRKGGDFVLYGVVPVPGTFAFSAMPGKGRLLQWVLNYTDSKNYVLIQMDDNNFYRTVIRNGEKTDQIKVPDKGDKKSFRTLHIRISSTEIVHQIRHGDSWTVLDRWTQPGANLSLGQFGFYIPGSDEVALSSFAYYADLNAQ
jgi:tetratricopeptide (TPR) repeat protein